MRTRVGAVAVAALAAVAGVLSTSILVGTIVAIVLALAAALVLVTRRVGRGSPSVGRSADVPADAPSTAELAARASHALVQVDDAVLTSEQELGFAIAVFGERAMAPFSAAVESARAERREAFRLRQLVDDGPADSARERRLLAEVSERCSAASRVLDEQAEAFDQAQDMSARAPRLVAEIDTHIAQQVARVSQSRQVLDRLASKYTPDATAAVASNPDHAATRLEFAGESLASAELAITGGNVDQAAVLLQAAEAGADQATDLLTGVLHMEAELTQAASAVPGALREIDAEIAEAMARVTGTPDEERAALISVARSVSDTVRVKVAAGAFDSLVALRDLQQADAALDRALGRVRTPEARRQRAVAVVDEAMLVARSSVTAAEDFITTRRGGVGVTARTRLAEAWRHYQQAIAAVQRDPEVALTDAQEADALAVQAREFAEQDVAGASTARVNSDEVAAAGTTNAGTRLRGAILGGILIDDRAGGVGPGSFGGVGTRGRRSVGHPEFSITGQHGSTDEHEVSDQQTVSDQQSLSDQQTVSDQQSLSDQRSVSDSV